MVSLNVPLEVRCLINGLFCASEAMLCGHEGVWASFVESELALRETFLMAVD
jgi:hypothetical protein